MDINSKVSTALSLARDLLELTPEQFRKRAGHEKLIWNWSVDDAVRAQIIERSRNLLVFCSENFSLDYGSEDASLIKPYLNGLAPPSLDNVDAYLAFPEKIVPVLILRRMLAFDRCAVSYLETNVGLVDEMIGKIGPVLMQ